MIDKTKIKDGMVIHCPTEDDARELMQVLFEMGFSWWGGSGILSSSIRWGHHKEETCYHIIGHVLYYSRLGWLINKGCAITKFSDLLCDTPPTADSIDLINHPPHYTDGGIETIDFIEAKKLPYHLGNVVKYISRAGKKEDELKDVKKARWYLDRYIGLLEGERTND